jgi:hypothetical protein
VVLYLKMGLSVVEACHEAAADLKALQRSRPGWVTIHAIDAQGQPYVLCAGHEGDINYWLWQEGMVEPEQRQAEVEAF